ncbi:T9SS type A sorting domain-containing protein [Chitinophaga pendula]|uniref:T9SS type A sorting domain-containing protein n=1 Tax=Chitinophaga TaxID=79328 RepID=UPI0012FDDF24|nr:MULTISPECIES: T9SS type A sorting domain-containing protein [Chitinophaga]UCJ06281.1 T9SS type A sorting domain-containing protein [Chitinophaga pendula]
MHKKLPYFLLSVLSLLTGLSSFGQEKAYPLGSTRALLQEILAQSTPGQRVLPEISLPVSSSKRFRARLNVQESNGANNGRLIGEVSGVAHSNFFMQIAGNELKGHIMLADTREAYRYYSDAAGNAYVTSVDINELICMNLEQPAGAGLQGNTAAAAAWLPETFSFQSYPGGNGCVLLDFDGQYVAGTPWNNGNPIDALPANLTDAEVRELWELVSEDYRALHINITTSEAVFNTYPKNRRMRCIITPTNTAAPGSGGVALISSFNWNDDSPCWVFNGGAKAGGEAASHEIGHTLGLGHDGRPGEGYFAGHGNWAPIMGVGYYRPISQWSKGEYANANNKEDDLAIMTDSRFGVGYRIDDYGNTRQLAANLPIGRGDTVKVSGVIDRTGDIDLFTFKSHGGRIKLDFNPVARHADLDILVTLSNQQGNVIVQSDPAGLSAQIDTIITAGNYYLSVTGTGAGDPVTNGYSNYSSLGAYTIAGTIKGGKSKGYAATVYPACGCDAGAGIGLDPGNYTRLELQQKGIADKDISSLEIKGGYEILLYKSSDLSGPYKVFRDDVSCLTKYQLNDSISSVRVRSLINQAPLVKITSPLPSLVYAAPVSKITIAAEAEDVDGTIVKVEFFNGTTKLGEDSVAPYTYDWLNVGAGAYNLVIKATDDRGSVSTTQQSLTVSSEGAATFYQDCYYGGAAVALVAGSYDLAQMNIMGIPNDWVSSIKVKAGYEILAYRDAGFSGPSYVLGSDIDCMVNTVVNGETVNLNDWVSSMVIRPVASAARIAAIKTDVEKEADRTVLVAPNPVVDRVTVRVIGKANHLYIRVFDINGKETLAPQRIGNGQQLNLSQLKPGVYVISITADQQVITRKLIKQ